MNKDIKEKIWGSFAALAVGDAMGMPFHELTPDQIKSRSGGYVDSFYPIFDDEFIHLHYLPGQVTDDTTLTMVTANAILKYGGRISTELFIEELSFWVKNNQTHWEIGNVYGPTTKATFNDYLNGTFYGYLNKTRSWCYIGTSNGCIMRISPAGWAHPGDWQAAVELACNLTLPTHPTDVALSAASGQAAAISQALSSNATVDSIIDAALQGAKMGELIGKKITRNTGQRYPLPNLELALELAGNAKDPYEACYQIRRCIGSHLHASEALATAIGIFYAAKGDLETSILVAVNNGGDSDTIASVVGALAGAYKGIRSVPERWVSTVGEVNKIDFEKMASDFHNMIKDSF